MLENTPRLALPLLAAGQAQKEVTHNEALIRADMLIQPVVQASGINTPPTTPSPGQCWIIGESPNGVWSDQAACMACWTDAGWVFASPFAGMTALNLSNGQMIQYKSGQWVSGEVNAAQVKVSGVQVIGAQRPAISNPSGGSTLDSEARITIASILSALRDHGLIAG
jgi:hypothetical protein